MDRLKILVVDDESRMRKLVRDFLVKSNFEVLEAGDGEEALDIFYKDKDIALIILDVMMPKMDGWQPAEMRETSCRVFSWEWTSIFPNPSAPRSWWRGWKRSYAGRTS